MAKDIYSNEPLTARELLTAKIGVEQPESAYRRGYRDGVLALLHGIGENLPTPLLNAVYEWALTGELATWQAGCVRDGYEIVIAPDMPN